MSSILFRTALRRKVYPPHIGRRPLATLLERAVALRQLANEKEVDKALHGSNNTSDTDHAMAIFDSIDVNGDGVLSREEFRVAIEKMRHLDLEKMKHCLIENDITFSHKASILGRRLVVSEEFNAWQYIKTLPPYQYVSHLCPPVALPPKQAHHPQYTLALDLDETLVHCTVDEPEEDGLAPDYELELDYRGEHIVVYAYCRPFLQEFLDSICDKFEVVIFTASQSLYANKMLDLLDPENKYFHHRLFREACMNLDGNVIKDLNVLNRDLSKTMLVDNAPHNFGYQLDCGIPISSWYSDRNDKELAKLEWFLRTLHVDDVRPLIRDQFQCHQLVEDAQDPIEEKEKKATTKADSGRFCAA